MSSPSSRAQRTSKVGQLRNILEQRFLQCVLLISVPQDKRLHRSKWMCAASLDVAVAYIDLAPDNDNVLNELRLFLSALTN